MTNDVAKFCLRETKKDYVAIEFLVAKLSTEIVTIIGNIVKIEVTILTH